MNSSRVFVRFQRLFPRSLTSSDGIEAYGCNCTRRMSMQAMAAASQILFISLVGSQQYSTFSAKSMQPLTTQQRSTHSRRSTL